MASVDVTKLMPPELLTYTLDYTRHNDVMCAATVSRRWRTAASMCRKFYQKFTLGHKYHTVENAGVDDWLARVSASAPQPLKLVICANDSSCQYLWSGKMHQRVLDVLAAVLPRTKRLDCMIAGDRYLTAILDRIAQSIVPLLRRLHISLIGPREITFCLPTGLLDLDAPNLRRLHLRNLRLGPARAALFGRVQWLQMFQCEFSLTVTICGQFPSLGWLSADGCLFLQLENTPNRSSSCPTLETLDLVGSSPDETNLAQVDFSSTCNLNVSGVPSLVPFLGRLDQNDWAELRTVYDNRHPMTTERISDALVQLTIHHVPLHSVSNTQSSTRTLTVALCEDGYFQPMVGEIAVMTPIVRHLTTVELVHPVLCELLALAPSLPQLTQIMDNIISRNIAEEFWLGDKFIAECSGLQELQLFSHAWLGDSQHQNIVVSAKQLSKFCSKLGLLNDDKEGRAQLVLIGVSVEDAEKDENVDDYRGAFAEVKHEDRKSCPSCLTLAQEPNQTTGVIAATLFLVNEWEHYIGPLWRLSA